MGRNLITLSALLTALLMPLACTGDLGGLAVVGGPQGGASGHPMGGANSAEEPVETPIETPAVPGEPIPHALTRLARLTHAQYDNSVSDLLASELRLAREFLEDPAKGGFDNNVEALFVTGRLGRDYRRAAEELASEAVENTEIYSTLLPCTDSQSDCSEQFVDRMGLRIFRRPLTDSERTRYVSLFAKGPDLVASGDAFKDGVRVTIEAMLQSPKFLYRVELSSRTDTDGAILLDDFELATRLSFLLWNTAPDDELLNLAQQGALSDEFSAQASRLLNDPRSQDVVLDFHAQWLHISGYEDLSKSPTLFPDFDPGLAQDLKTETLEFVRYVTYEQKSGLQTLLTAPYTMANATIARFYDEELPGSAFERLDLDPEQRAGLFTQIGFLASRAYPDTSSPIHRGVFMLHNVLCEDIPPPPGDVEFTLTREAREAPTKRKQVEIQTSSPGCVKCHGLINPIGFGFEHFDAMGQYREQDGDEEIDSSGSIQLRTSAISFDGAVDMVGQLAQSELARACYARQWLRYALARNSVPGDEASIEALSGRLQSDTFTAADLLLEVTKLRSFVSRPEELQ